MSIKDEVREFLTTRRARVAPTTAGIPTTGARRVPGLRREEVAQLAGVSTDYYVRLERGNLSGVSEQVLGAVARALRLDHAERAHLFDLARASTGPVRGSRRTAISRVRPVVLQILESLGGPSYVRNARMDVLAANNVGFALYDGVFERDGLPLNLARFVFLSERSSSFFLDWDTIADDTAAALRTEAGSNPHDRSLTELVGELATCSEDFAARWARHNVKYHREATKRLRSTLVGEVELTCHALELTGDGLTIITYTAEPDSAGAEALQFLASWAVQQSSTRPR